MEFKDYYKILGVAPDAEIDGIKKTYRKLARKYHPDVSKQRDAEEKFKEAGEAYEVLKNTEKRAEYDAIRQYGSQGQAFRPPPDWQPPGGSHRAGQSQYSEGFSDFFSTIFGAGQDRYSAPHHERPSPHRRGRDVETDMPVFLEDTLADNFKPLSYHLNGENKTLKIKIPAGVTDGERIRLKGQGETGIGKGENGDLYLRIKLVPHPLFDVEYHDLNVVVPLAPWEAALGAKIEVPTLSGRIQLTIPPNSQTGQRLRIRGQGLKTKTGRGNLYAVLKIMMPNTSSETVKRHWQQLSEQAGFDPRSEWSGRI